MKLSSSLRSLPSALALFLMLTTLTGPEPLWAVVFAERLAPENLARLRQGGPDAIAGLGDWALGNGVLCAAISDAEHESVLSARGGVLVDLGHCGRADDQWGVLQPMLNLSRKSALPVAEMRAETQAGEAHIIASGQLNGLYFETRYSVDLVQPRRLRVRTVLQRTRDGEAMFLFGDIALHGHRQLTPFTLSSERPDLSPGFVHPAIDTDSSVSMARAMVSADAHVLVGGTQLEPGIAYGWRLVDARLEQADGTQVALPPLAANGEHFSMLGAFSRPLWLGGGGAPGLIELAQMFFMELEVGERLSYERELILGARADVSSVTDQLWPDGPLVEGQLDDPAARIHVRRLGGAPVTEVRPSPDGRFRFRLPTAEAIDYVLEARAPGGRSLSHPLRVEGARVRVGRLAVGRPAILEIPPMGPLRLVFLGIAPTPDPRFGDELLGFRLGEEEIQSSTVANHISLAGAQGDPSRLVLAPGSYRVLATRGPEWSVSQRELRLEAGASEVLEIEPPVKLIGQPGWISADLHVHAQASDDTAFPLRRRIAAFAAQGADVVVATEHDYISDYGPMIRALGLSQQIASITGAEVTSTVRGAVTPHTSGHSNAFPLTRRPELYRAGAPRGEDRRLRDLAADLRSLAPRPVLQLNHPRESGFDTGNGSYFSHLAVAGQPFEPTRPLAAEPNRVLIERDSGSGLRDLDFDAIELLNGPSMSRYRLTRADWFSLLLQGEIRSATANSDSHRPAEIVALPRNQVVYTGPRGPDLDTRVFVEAVRAGRLYGTTGPLLDVRLGERGPGEAFVGEAGQLRITVQAVPWVPVSEARVYLDGALHRRIDLREKRDVSLPLSFSADAFVTVEIEGELPPGGPSSDARARSIYAALAPGFTPFAFTNPIFVDHNGDGRWAPPGLPTPLPVTLSDPLASP